MQQLNLRLASLLLLCGIVCVSFTHSPLSKKDKKTIPAHAWFAPRQSTYYYYYIFPGDTYDTLLDQGDEIYRLEAEYQVYIDTSPFGGTVIAKGYSNTDYPHDTFAQSILYAHY